MASDSYSNPVDEVISHMHSYGTFRSHRSPARQSQKQGEMGDPLDFREFEGLLEQAKFNPEEVQVEDEEEEEEKGFKKQFLEAHTNSHITNSRNSKRRFTTRMRRASMKRVVATQKTVVQYVKLVFPHVALVLVVCMYACAGATVFYKVESPNEHKVKEKGIEEIKQLRTELVETMWKYSRRGNQPVAHTIWTNLSDAQLTHFTAALYKNFKDNFVSYRDVRYKVSEGGDDDDDVISRRGSPTGDAWTPASAIFFAATTMATIGYGNIVPVTSTGRILCVFFALFGAPLAIITIGDLGKFLSECTIWLYKQIKLCRKHMRARMKRWKGEKRKSMSGTLSTSEIEGEDDETEVDDAIDWEDLILDKTQVPVAMVFAILLLYIALGALLFSFMEGWTYVDSFYFCFITLTTVGFGDLVPKKHQYIALMLLYIGLGLAVTTMCIDLVGITYIQKIHYFGRKFKGTDLLQLLKRRKMMEAVLAQRGDLMQLYFERAQQQESKSGSLHAVSPILYKETDWDVEPVDNLFVYEPPKMLPSPSIASTYSTAPSVSQREMYFAGLLSPRSLTNSGPDVEFSCSLSTPASVIERDLMFFQRSNISRDPSWIESGPDLSNHCSLDTTPSQTERDFLYNVQYERCPSATSFKHEFLHWPGEWLANIAQTALNKRKLKSCPDRIIPIIHSPQGLSCMESWYSYKEMEEESKKIKLRLPAVTVDEPSSKDDDDDVEPPSLLSPMDLDPDFPSSALTTPLTSPSESELDFGAFEVMSEGGVSVEEVTLKEEPLIYHESLPVHSVHHQTVKTEQAVASLMNCPDTVCSGEAPPVVVSDNYCFVVDGEKVSQKDIMGDDHWWRHTSRPTKYYFSDDLKRFYKVNILQAKGKVLSARFPKSKMPNHPTMNLAPSTSPRTSRSDEGDLPMNNVFKVIRFYSFWKTCPSFHRIVTVIGPADDAQNNPLFKKRIFVQYLWRNAKETDKQQVAREFNPHQQKLLQHVTNAPAIKKVSSTSSHRSASSSEDLWQAGGSSPEHESIIEFPVQINVTFAQPTDSARTSVSIDLEGHDFDSDSENEDSAPEEDQPVYHRNVPVYKTNAQPMDSNAAIHNAVQCPVKYLSKAPPQMVTENFCFVLDGDTVPLEDLVADTKWWKSTGKSTCYYYSSDLRSFSRVQTVRVKERVISARTAVRKVSGVYNQKEVPLENVFKVFRMFSYWRSCRKFHRIVSTISPVSTGQEKLVDFNQRIFVQYLWREAKEADKIRVALEFVPCSSTSLIRSRSSLAPPRRHRRKYTSSALNASPY